MSQLIGPETGKTVDYYLLSSQQIPHIVKRIISQVINFNGDQLINACRLSALSDGKMWRRQQQQREMCRDETNSGKRNRKKKKKRQKKNAICHTIARCALSEAKFLLQLLLSYGSRRATHLRKLRMSGRRETRKTDFYRCQWYRRCH